MEDINDVDYAHAKRVFKDLKIRNLGDYYDFWFWLIIMIIIYVQSDAFLLADVFGNFKNMCLKIYELDLAHFLFRTSISMPCRLKKDPSKARTFNYTVYKW